MVLQSSVGFIYVKYCNYSYKFQNDEILFLGSWKWCESVDVAVDITNRNGWINCVIINLEFLLA